MKGCFAQFEALREEMDAWLDQSRRLDPPSELAEHLRFVHLAVAAHRVSAEERYLDWALRYGGRRAQMILDRPEGPLPLAWDADASPVWPASADDAQRRAAGAAHHAPGDPL